MDISPHPHSIVKKTVLLFLKQNNETFLFHEECTKNNCFHPVSSFNNKDIRGASHKIKAIYCIIYRK